jgi:nucleoside-diphosphate-sugar epimerase
VRVANPLSICTDMNQTESDDRIIDKHDLILITGASGFIGSKVVDRLLDLGFKNLRCFIRSSHSSARIPSWSSGISGAGHVQVFQGNLLSREDCNRATESAAVIFHLAAGRGEKSYPDAFLNSVVTTRNLIEASIDHGVLRRFVGISSFAVYSNTNKAKRRLLDESCPIEPRPDLRGDAYTFAKVKQEEIVLAYGKKFGMPYVILRPGHVYGPGNEAISGRIGINTFGVFLHLGGPNRVPLTYVDNCADAIVLAGLKPGIDGEVFNVVDDNLPSSRQVLRLYKRHVKRFKSIYLPHIVTYGLCYLWERYSSWSEGQLPPAFNRKRWHAMWKKTSYSNTRLKTLVGWIPRISMEEGLNRYFASCRGNAHND